MDIKLLSIKTTNCLTAVCLSTEIASGPIIYYLNNEENQVEFSPEKEINSTSYRGTYNTEQILIRNMYNSTDVFYKSAIYSKPISKRNNTTYDFINSFSYNMTQPLTNIEKIGNTLYSQGNLSPCGHVRTRYDSYSFLSIDNGSYELYDISVDTIIYDKQKIKTILRDAPTTLITSDISLCSYIGVNYNMLYEFPGNIWNDFTSGNIAANTLRCKNQLDSHYNMTYNSDNVFSNCRNYIKILPCNNQLYLKYIDNINYNISSTNILSSNINSRQYESIEGVNAITRYSNRDGNKSTLYSLKIKTNLLSENLDKQILDTIKTSIQSITYSLAKKLQPATSELINVYLESK